METLDEVLRTEVAWDPEWVTVASDDNQSQENEGESNEEQLMLCDDPRWQLLDERAQALVLQVFAGDLDHAIRHADWACSTLDRPHGLNIQIHRMHMMHIHRTCTCRSCK